MLSPDQTAALRRDGYLVIPSLFETAQLNKLTAAAYEFIDTFDFSAHRSVFSTQDADQGRDELFFRSAETVQCFLEEDALNAAGDLTVEPRQAVNKIGHALHDHLPEYQKFCRQGMIGELLREIGYANPLLWQTMVIFKPPRIGGEVRWHQDASYLISEPADVTGMWIAMEDATRENGCLWVQPGQHRQALCEIYTVDWSSRSGTLRTLAPRPEAIKPVPLEVAAGSLVLFSDHMPHYSSANTSKRSRVAFTMHVADASSNWHPENWIQRPNLGAFRL